MTDMSVQNVYALPNCLFSDESTAPSPSNSPKIVKEDTFDAEFWTGDDAMEKLLDTVQMREKAGDFEKVMNKVLSKMDEVRAKTPYQGPRRVYGEFQCSNCKKKWVSGYSWANTAQLCANCKCEVFPHVQKKLIKSNVPLDEVPIMHKSELCKKCIESGHFCRRLRFT
ncbi:DgyrCDS5653 [Dimorphilus gyrociliatus]|uniref:DgyrCDS5653 n=1 Tax=Dimorphilus gyrociliatus TaxID=2664684 RepID=A0A7I8VL63_9ANNE|nr:DgyrCDS5653 [Dimorphilus gyrociliatus]